MPSTVQPLVLGMIFGSFAKKMFFNNFFLYIGIQSADLQVTFDENSKNI